MQRNWYLKAKSPRTIRMMEDLAELEEDKQQCLTNIAKEIVRLRDCIYFSALVKRDFYVEASIDEAEKHKHLPEEERRKYFCFYQPDVRFRSENRSCDIKWCKIAPRSHKEAKPKDGEPIRTTRKNYVRQGKGLTYGVPRFEDQPEWAKKMIEETEISFRMLRDANEFLNDILRAVYKLSSNTYNYHQREIEKELALAEEWGLTGVASGVSAANSRPTIINSQIMENISTKLHKGAFTEEKEAVSSE